MQTGAGPRGAEPFRRLARAAARAAPLWCFLALAVAFYVFILSAGTWIHWRTWTVFYDAQAEGFRHGHLYLPEVPSAALQALPNPYDPAKMQLWRWDHVYYRGHFYVYWGLVPPLLLAIFKTIFRVKELIADDVMVFAFVVIRLVAGTMLIRALAARAQPRPSRWAVWLALAVFAIGHPTPFLLARSGVYEGAIFGGVCFMVTGLYLAFRGIASVSPGRAARWLGAASLCFGLAGGTRISLLPCVVVLVCFNAFVRWRIEGGGRGPLLRIALPACGPAALVTLFHLLLNYLRFGAWTEFGARYQLGLQLSFGARFLLPDVFGYFFCPPAHACTFPFLFSSWNTARALAPRWLTWPVDLQTKEPTVGLFAVAAFTWLAVVGPVLAALRRWRRREEVVASARAPAAVWEARWILGAPLLYVVASAAPLLFMSGTTMRYEADFASGVLLLATLFGWRLLAAPASRAGRAAAVALYVALAIGTLAASSLFAFTGYFEHFKRNNPTFMHRLEKSLSVCRPPPGATSGRP